MRRREKPVVSIERTKLDSGQEPIDKQAGPSARMEQQERAEQVQAALAALSEEHRAILILREIDGFDYDQIAEILDLPVGTVRSRLHRAVAIARPAKRRVARRHEIDTRAG